MMAGTSSTGGLEITKKHFPFGVVSFAFGMLSILAGALWLYFGIECLKGQGLPLELDPNIFCTTFFEFIIWFQLAFAITGLGFGIAAVRLEKQRRGLAIVGIVFSSPTILAYIAILMSSLPWRR